MARKAMPTSMEGRAGIVRALQLVDEIDTAVAPAPQANRDTKFFQHDIELFEQKAAPAKPTLVATQETVAEAAKQPVTLPATGAKLVIRKANHTGESAPAQPAPSVEAIAPAVEVPEPIMPERLAIDNPRIVIIRRKAEDMPDVNVGSESAA
jgi:hypothetical protein